MATSRPIHESDRGVKPMEIIQDPAVEADVFRSGLDRHREFLEERIDPDFGLLDRLRSNKGITFRQNQEISAVKVPFRKSRMILDYILQGPGSDKIAKFRQALRETKQEHLVNYVDGDGEYRPQFGGNWPIGEAKVEILDDNITFLTENIDCAHGLLACMIQKKAITQRQMESISVHHEPCKRNEALLDIIRRVNQSEFEGTIESLKATNQESIADVLIHGGMVLSVHSKADSNLPAIDPAEEEIVHQIDEILQNKTPEETRNILESCLSLKNSGLILAKRKKSIVFFFHCKNINQLRRLLELLVTDALQKTIEMIYNRVLSTSSNVRVKVTWNDAEYNKAERKLQEIEPELAVVESKVESTRMEVKRGDCGAMDDQNPPSPLPTDGDAVDSQQPSSFPVSSIPASTGTPKEDRKTKKGKITKDDIGPPTDFRHLQHVGWDPEKGAFDVDKLDSDMKEFFGHAHVSPFQLQDSETAMFIYNFIEVHGGIQTIKEEQQQRAARRPPPPVPSIPVVVQEPTQITPLTTDGDTGSRHASLVHETNHGDSAAGKMKREPNFGPFLADVSTTTTSDLDDAISDPSRHPVVQFRVVLSYKISAFITWPETPGDCSSPESAARKALGYRLRYRRADETGVYVTRSLSENLVLIENLAPNTKYRYQVKYVLENEGETPWSRENELDTSHGQTKDQAVSMSY